jgi:hypothetical protein
MTNHRINMRLSGTEADLKAYLYLLHAIDKKGLIEILEESKPYSNKGSFSYTNPLALRGLS